MAARPHLYAVLAMANEPMTIDEIMRAAHARMEHAGDLAPGRDACVSDVEGMRSVEFLQAPNGKRYFIRKTNIGSDARGRHGLSLNVKLLNRVSPPVSPTMRSPASAGCPRLGAVSMPLPCI